MMQDKLFRIHQIQGRIGNMTLIDYENKLLLIDTGSKKDYRLLEHFIRKKLNRKMTDIKLAAVSHVHPDHSGGVHALRKKYRIPAAGHPDMERWYAGLNGRMQQFADVCFSHFTAIQHGVPARRFWFKKMGRPDHMLKDGEPLPFFDDWVAWHTPGHTTTDICYYHSQSKTLYAGDVMVAVNGTYHLAYGITLPDWMEWSLKKLAALDIATLILPHGGVNNISSMETIVTPLFREIHRRLGFPVRLIKPFTMLSPAISRHRALGEAPPNW